MRKMVEPILYRDLCHTNGPVTCYYWCDYPRLFMTLIARPELIQYVHSYTGPLTPYLMIKDEEQALRHSGADTRQLTLAERIELATTIFTQAVNIRDVHFIDDGTSHTNDLWQSVTQALSDKKLKRIALVTWSYRFPMAPLLRAQPGLKRLEISSLTATGLEDLDGTDLLLLENLECSAVQVASLVPGRPGRLNFGMRWTRAP
ncbi:hypothetical protein FRC01_005789 [Tulasnella sp. 417]|nr:hypothetical protein FRC01_005789 [Tulasnella sp. 417]